tara:strand:- start:674 stop:1639 length:966 start_codon:yes stop_codon:yes gene_type:complete
MSGGGGSNSGGNDMEVSGMEAAVSKEKGIHTHADTRHQSTSYSGGDGGNNVSVDKGGPHYTGPTMGPNYNTGTVENFRVNPTTGKITGGAWSDSEIEKGYTDEGEKLDQVGAGQYMTKAQQYSTGLIEKDPETGKDVQGRYKVNENTGQIERADMTFAEHWANAPEAIRMSPTLRFLYASGKNIGEWMGKKNFKGYNEAGMSTDPYGWLKGDSSKFEKDSRGIIGGGDNESRQIMNQLAPSAPYTVAGTTAPQSSVAGNWYKNLGSQTNNGFGFSFAKSYAAAKTKQAGILGNPSPVGWLAVNQSPFYNFLKARNLDKGIL